MAGKPRQWLWFAGLYLTGLAALTLLGWLIRLLLA